MGEVLSFHHICVEVDDIDAAATVAARTFGAGPFFVLEHAPFDELEVPGVTCRWDHSLAFGYFGSLLVELHQTHSLEPPELGDVLGRRPIAHIAYLVEDLEAQSARLAANGCPRVLFGRNGPVALVYHHVPDVGLVELIQPGEFRGFWDAVAARTAEWDGTRPLQPASSLF